MADPNSCSSAPPPPPPPPAANFTLETDDISSLLNTLLQNSSAPPPPAPSTSTASDMPIRLPQTQQPMFMPPAPGVHGQFYGSVSFPGSAASESSSGLNLAYFGSQGCARYENAFSCSIESSGERIAEFDYESEKDHEASEMRPNPPPVKSSSKRARAAEVHNLSEKRRRQRINEKMKALQKLIPNSNKTDKASMLDEAIEYLKQLQLQVQMLAMRNGSTLHPFYLSSTVPSVQPPQVAAVFDEGNGLPSTSTRAVFSANQDIPLHNMFDFSSSLDQKIFIPTEPEKNNLHPSLGIESSGSFHDRPSNFSPQNKELCKDIKFQQFQLQVSRGENSSSGLFPW
ncbi:hypothetical protein Dimus_004525 [Dionaea muscipula]